jgi:hypothetical protein
MSIKIQTKYSLAAKLPAELLQKVVKDAASYIRPGITSTKGAVVIGGKTSTTRMYGSASLRSMHFFHPTWPSTQWLIHIMFPFRRLLWHKRKNQLPEGAFALAMAFYKMLFHEFYHIKELLARQKGKKIYFSRRSPKGRRPNWSYRPEEQRAMQAEEKAFIKFMAEPHDVFFDFVLELERLGSTLNLF